MLNEDSETTQGLLQGATGVPPNNELNIYHLHSCHSRQAWIKGMTQPFPCDCGLTTYISTLCNETLTNIEQSVKMHTVPEGKDLVTRHYVLNTLEFERTRLKELLKDIE